MDSVDSGSDTRDGRIWGQSMTQVEDMTARACCLDDLMYTPVNLFGGCVDCRWVQIALDGKISQDFACAADVDPPVQRDGVCTRLSQPWKEWPRVAGEVQPWRAGDT